MRTEMKVYMSHTDAEAIRLAAKEERIPVSQFMREAAMRWTEYILRDAHEHHGPGHVSRQAIEEHIPTLRNRQAAAKVLDGQLVMIQERD